MAIKRKTRMYEPWGYQEENNYQGSETIFDNDLESFFADAQYTDADKKIHFYNKDGEEKASLDVTKFAPSVVESAIYDKTTKILTITFSNGDKVEINLADLIDENEFADGLMVDNGIVKVMIDSTGEPYLSVSGNGVKISGVDQAIEIAVEAEKTRAEAAEQALQEAIDAEQTRAETAEQTLDDKIDQEIADRKADVDEEEERAKEAEANLSRRLDTLNDELDAEEAIREAADVALGRRIDQEIDDRKADVDEEEARAKAAEDALDAKIDAEEARAISAETELQTVINNVIDSVNDLEINKFDNAEYDSSAKTINFLASGEVVATINATDFIKDGMIDDVKIENGNLVIVFNTDSGKEDISIPLTDIFDPSNYYTKNEVDAEFANVEQEILSAVTALNTKDEELQGEIDLKASAASVEALEGAVVSHTDNADIHVTANDKETWNGKADASTVYTQAEVDALIKAKETEIYNLTKLVGEIGGNVTYTYPNELGTSLTSLLGNYGTVKLGEDATITRFGPGVTAKNKVTLNLNTHNLTSTSAGGYGAIMARGTQEITIGGKGTIDAGDGICIEANGAGATISLTGSTTVYHNNRPGGELIYCYAGTINITNGTFKNDGESNYTLNCYDANYAAGTAKIVVTGGKFYDFNPADNSAEGEHTSFVPEGYHVETSTVVEEGVEHTVYTVKKNS